MTAERYTDAARGLPRQILGTGTWFRQLDWFADPEIGMAAPSRVRLPFSVSTLREGRAVARREKQGLLYRDRTTTHPFQRRRLARPRIVYTNRFSSMSDADPRFEE